MARLTSPSKVNIGSTTSFYNLIFTQPSGDSLEKSSVAEKGIKLKFVLFFRSAEARFCKHPTIGAEAGSLDSKRCDFRREEAFGLVIQKVAGG